MEATRELGIEPNSCTEYQPSLRARRRDGRTRVARKATGPKEEETRRKGKAPPLPAVDHVSVPQARNAFTRGHDEGRRGEVEVENR
jgi:hypothetical protein